MFVILDIVEFHENYNLTDIVTPIKVDRLESLLKESLYNAEKIEYLCDGFRNGFHLGYNGPERRQDRSENIPLNVGTKTELWNKVMKEVKLKCYAGPFETIPFDDYMQSPIGLVPKAGNQTRQIFHLSYDFGLEDRQKSFNFHTPDHLCKVKYNDLDHAVETCLSLVGKGSTKPIYFAKTDLKSAFRTVPGMPRLFKFLTMKCQHPINNKWYFFSDKCLPFGSAISCAIFNDFSNCLKHLIEHRLGITFRVTNYLDDFLFIADSEQECNAMVREFLVLCEEIGCPIAEDKTQWASVKIVFLGIGLDGERHMLTIPEDKRLKALNAVTHLINKKKATIREVQCLTGTLNFLHKAIVPGRTFTRSMYVPLKSKNGKKLPQHYHVQLPALFREDCKIWVQFLQNSGSSRICRPFVDWSATWDTNTLDFYTDASKNKSLGLGCVFGPFYTWKKWEPGFIERCNPSIAFLEFYALCVGIFTWAKSLQNMRIEIFCDNTSVRDIVNSMTTNCPKCLSLMKLLILDNMIHNRHIKVTYIESAKNERADALSRLDLNRFFNASPLSRSVQPSPISQKLWPLSTLWEQLKV